MASKKKSTRRKFADLVDKEESPEEPVAEEEKGESSDDAPAAFSQPAIMEPEVTPAKEPEPPAGHYRCIYRVNFGGRMYMRGDMVPLDPDSAKRFLKLRAVEYVS